MKTLAYPAALASLLAASTANAQEASTAFQCALPYEDSMIAMGSLEVLSQSDVKAFPGLHGEGHLIEFAPGTTKVYGATPEKLTLEILTPHSLQARKKHKTTFTATFAKSDAANDAIQQSVTWSIQCGALDFCIRQEEGKPEGSGRLEYRQKDKLTLECIFEFTPEEFDALGN